MWRNGSALDSKSKGCEFKSRRPQILYFRMNDAIIINNKKTYTIDGINIRIHANLLYLFLHNIFNA